MPSATDSQLPNSQFPSLHPQPSPQSNTHIGDNNKNNSGVLKGSHNKINSDNVNNIFNITESKNELHELLYPHISNDALHDFLKCPPQCHPGTRKTVRNAITQWASNPEASPVLWLYGPAGVGKSVIAKTISESTDQIQVIASFFFSTSSDKSATTLFPTLAWQLAKNVPETKQYIVAALACNRLLPISELEKQFDHLIVQPLRRCESTMMSGLVMVIDGVDECIDEKMQSHFLNILKGAGKNGGLPLRFLICSRPEPRLRAILEDDYGTAKPRAKSLPTTNSNTSDILQISPTVPNTSQSEIPIVPSPKQQSLSLGYQVQIKIYLYLSVAKAQLDASLRWRPGTVLPLDAWKLYRPMQLGVDKAYPSSQIPDELDKLSPCSVISRIQIRLSEESKEDVRIYLTDKFNAVPRSKNDAIVPQDIEDLVNISCGHFLYASTIVKLLDDPSWNAKDVLKMACSSSLPTPDLDKLYSAILDNAGEVMRRDNHGAETDLATLRDVFGILVVLWENAQLANIPESFPIIECLLGLEKDKLKQILRKMHSIFDIIPGKSIRVYHRSFFEFLQHHNQDNQHYISYSIALQRFLFMLGQVGLRYRRRRCCGLLRDDEKKQAKHVRNMVPAFPRTFFRRSANPTKLATFYALVHTSITALLSISSFWLSLDFWDYLVISLVPPLYVSFVRYLLIMVLFLLVAFGCFTVSLKCYMLYIDLDRSNIYPLFHPFLHPIFVTAIECLLSG